MRFVRYDEVEVGGRKEPLVPVVEEQRLDGCDDDFGASPVIPVFLVNDRREVVRQKSAECRFRLSLEFEAIHEKENATRVSRSQEEFDDRRGCECFARARRHFEQESVAAFPYGVLEPAERRELIRTQKAKLVGFDEAVAFRIVAPRGFAFVSGTLRQGDIVVVDGFLHEPVGVRNDLLARRRGFRRGEGRHDGRIAAFEIPEVVKIAVRQEDKAAVSAAGVFSGLFLSRKRVFSFGFRFEDDKGPSSGIEQQEVDESPAGFLEVVAESFKVAGFECDAGFEKDIRRNVAFREETPSGGFEKFVDPDSCSGFVCRHPERRPPFSGPVCACAECEQNTNHILPIARIQYKLLCGRKVKLARRPQSGNGNGESSVSRVRRAFRTTDSSGAGSSGASG